MPSIRPNLPVSFNVPAIVTDAPLVSLGLPVYNGERYLSVLLDSIVAQTYANFELVISDNASTDGTPAICEEYARNDSRIVLHRNAVNRGAGWNHVRVHELSRGSFFKWCGADDAMDPRFVERTLAALLERPDAAIAYPLTVVIDDNGAEIDRTAERLPLDHPDATVRFARMMCPLPATQSVFYGMFRTRLMSRARPMGAFLAADRCFLAEVALYGAIVRVEEFLMYRRIHASHRTRDRLTEHRLYVPEARDSYRARELGVLRESIHSIWRAPLRAGTKVRLLGTVGAWMARYRRDLLYESKQVAAERLTHGRERRGTARNAVDEQSAG